MTDGFFAESFTSSVPYHPERIHAAAVYCSDGRFGEAFDDLMTQGLDLPRYDRLAVPGGAACLARHFKTWREEQGVIEQLRFLIDTHGIERVVLIAHQGCAFYSERLRVSPLQLESRQREDIARAVRTVRELSPRVMIDAFFAQLDRNGRVQFEAIRTGPG